MKFKVGDAVVINDRWHSRTIGRVVDIRNTRVAPYHVRIILSKRPIEIGKMYYFSGRDMDKHLYNTRNKIMTKFKVGDKIRSKSTTVNNFAGGEGIITEIDGDEMRIKVTRPSCHYYTGQITNKAKWGSDIELISERNLPEMGRRTFKLLKNIPDFKKGLLVQEACDDGDQEYKSINGDAFVVFEDYTKYFDNNEILFSRDSVEKQPNWFEEVFPATAEWLTKDELEEYKAFQNRKSTVVGAEAVIKKPAAHTGKYAWLLTLSVNGYKDVTSGERKRITAAAAYYKKRFDHNFSTKTMANGKVRVTRVR